MPYSLKELQRMQAQNDEKYWDHEGTAEESIRHVSLHLGKLIGKISACCEDYEHSDEMPKEVIEDEVIPDLLMHGLRLANLTGVDIEEKYNQRTAFIKEKFGD